MHYNQTSGGNSKTPYRHNSISNEKHHISGILSILHVIKSFIFFNLFFCCWFNVPLKHSSSNMETLSISVKCSKMDQCSALMWACLLWQGFLFKLRFQLTFAKWRQGRGTEGLFKMDPYIEWNNRQAFLTWTPVGWNNQGAFLTCIPIGWKNQGNTELYHDNFWNRSNTLEHAICFVQFDA
jgi:hypothetical protein